MYEDFVKLAQDSLKPAMKLAENNTALAVKLVQAQAENAAELMQGNLNHVKALIETKDLNVAVEMQQKYVEALNEKLATVAKDNAAAVEDRGDEIPNLRLTPRRAHRTNINTHNRAHGCGPRHEGGRARRRPRRSSGRLVLCFLSKSWPGDKKYEGC